MTAEKMAISNLLAVLILVILNLNVGLCSHIFLIGESVSFHFIHDKGHIPFSICHSSNKTIIQRSPTGCEVYHPYKDRVFVEQCYGTIAFFFTVEELEVGDAGRFSVCKTNDFEWSDEIHVQGFPVTITPSLALPLPGKTVALSCDIAAGVLVQHKSISYRWLRFTNSSRTVLDENKSVLTLDSVDYEDDGDLYECTVTYSNNQIGKSNKYLIRLYVPPTVASFTMNGVSGALEVRENVNVAVICQVFSSFPVNVTITYGGISKTTSFTSRSVRSAMELHVRSNCSLAGTFICSAENQFGQSGLQTLDLIVKCPPKLGKPLEVGIPLGESKTLTIPTLGNSLNVSVTGINANVTVHRSNLSIYIPPTSRELYSDSPYLNVTAVNELGNDTIQLAIRPAGAPESPYNLDYVETSQTSRKLTWTAGFPGQSNQSFIIEYYEGAYLRNWTILSNVSESEIDVTNTVNVIARRYHFRVKSYNNVGQSAYSNILSTTLTSSQSDPLKAPSELDFDELSETQATLKWQPDRSRAFLSSYIVEYHSGDNNWTIVSNGTLPMANVTYRQSGEKYYYRVKVVNEYEESEYSTIVLASAKPDTPSTINVDTDKTLVIVVTTCVAAVCLLIFVAMAVSTYFGHKRRNRSALDGNNSDVLEPTPTSFPVEPEHEAANEEHGSSRATSTTRIIPVRFYSASPSPLSLPRSISRHYSQ